MGSIISWNIGPDPNQGRKKVKATTTMRGGVSLISLAKTKAGVLKSFLSPIVNLQVTKVVNMPEIQKKVSTQRVPLKNHWVANSVTTSVILNPRADDNDDDDEKGKMKCFSNIC